MLDGFAGLNTIGIETLLFVIEVSGTSEVVVAVSTGEPETPVQSI
jgi:hypothetical protein